MGVYISMGRYAYLYRWMYNVCLVLPVSVDDSRYSFIFSVFSPRKVDIEKIPKPMNCILRDLYLAVSLNTWLHYKCVSDAEK